MPPAAKTLRKDFMDPPNIMPSADFRDLGRRTACSSIQGLLGSFWLHPAAERVSTCVTQITQQFMDLQSFQSSKNSQIFCRKKNHGNRRHASAMLNHWMMPSLDVFTLWPARIDVSRVNQSFPMADIIHGDNRDLFTMNTEDKH